MRQCRMKISAIKDQRNHVEDALKIDMIEDNNIRIIFKRTPIGVNYYECFINKNGHWNKI